jgi:hypothetical protein
VLSEAGSRERRNLLELMARINGVAKDSTIVEQERFVLPGSLLK